MPDERSQPDAIEALRLAADSGKFLIEVGTRHRAAKEAREQLVEDLLTLHGADEVDLVCEFRTLADKSREEIDFFSVRRVFERLLPRLDSAVEPTLECVCLLLSAAGEDLAAGTILNAYQDYCHADPARSVKTIELAQKSPKSFAAAVPPAIAALSPNNPRCTLELLRRVAASERKELKRAAAASIARCGDDWGADEAQGLLPILEDLAAPENDNITVAAVLRSAVALMDRQSKPAPALMTIARRILDTDGPQVIHAAADRLWIEGKRLAVEEIEQLVTCVGRVNSDHIGTIGVIDHALESMLEGELSELALSLLEHLLLRDEDPIDAKLLQGTARTVCSSVAVAGHLLTRWFLGANPALMRALRELFRPLHRTLFEVEVDESLVDFGDPAIAPFLARKAIGSLFWNPISAASYIISLIVNSDSADVRAELGKLLFDPLLLNYPGSTREYVEGRLEGLAPDARDSAKQAIVALDRYMEDLRGTDSAVALRAPQSHREIYRRRFNESMQESWKQAQRKSVLANLFQKSTLLYGRQSINYIHTGDGAPQRSVMPLGKHEHSFEMPRMANIDEFELDYMLRVFQLEQRAE